LTEQVAHVVTASSIQNGIAHVLLGTWQQILHLECDVCGRRRTIVTVIGV
jgi:thiamine phosphate synthase YjbQ (UPF0047 family)